MKVSTGVSPARAARSLRLLPAVARRVAALADAWLPAACIVCAGDESSGLCAGCELELAGSRIARCTRCGIGLGSRAPSECDACIEAPPLFSQTIVLADYAAPLDRVVQALKFGRDASLAAPLGRALARRVDAAPDSPCPGGRDSVVTAIPLTTKRLAERGFNQSLEIARAVARDLRLALEPRLLARRRESAPASTLHARERRDALRGAFEARGRLDGRVVFVVDDVMTTGATLDAAAEALVRAGAASVVNCVVARTPAR